jgi:uncharacterized protein (DUF433 family)
MTITSRTEMRSGQPCVGTTGLWVGIVVARVRDAGSIDAYLQSNDNVARLTRSDVEEALEFCASRKCMGSDTIEFCCNCTMLWTSAKTTKGREMVGLSDGEPAEEQSVEPPESEFERMWEAAATIARS